MEQMSKELYEANQLLERTELDAQGYVIAPYGRCPQKWHIYFYAIIGLIPVIGIISTIVFLYYGWPSFKGMTVLKNDNVVTVDRVPDNRYSKGYRVEANAHGASMKVAHPYTEEIEGNKRVGRLFVIGAVALFVVRVIILAICM